MGTAMFDLLSNIQMREGQTLVIGYLSHLFTASWTNSIHISTV